MKGRRYLVFAATALILAFSGCDGRPQATPANMAGTSVPQIVTVAKGDSPYYDSFEELSEKADWVIKGKVLKSRVEKIATYAGAPEERKEITTIYAVEVDDVYKGDVPAGDTIELLQTGGELGNEKWMTENAADIQPDREYVMFLSKSRLYANSAWLTNYQSIYTVDGGEFFGQGADPLHFTSDALERLKETAK